MARYYWLKLKKDFFKRHDIRIIEALPNGKDYVLFYLKLLLESIDHEGSLRFSDTIPYDENMLSTITNTNIDVVRSALKAFCELNLVEILEDRTIFMREVAKMVGSASSNDNAIRQQRYRDKQKLLSVTKSNASVTECVTNSNESKSIEKEIEKDFYNAELDKTFKEYLEYRGCATDIEKEKVKDKLVKLANSDEGMMIRILNQSMEQGWRGLYPIKKTSKANFTEREYDFDDLERRLMNK